MWESNCTNIGIANKQIIYTKMKVGVTNKKHMQPGADFWVWILCVQLTMRTIQLLALHLMTGRKVGKSDVKIKMLDLFIYFAWK